VAAGTLAEAVRTMLGADIGISTTGLHDLKEPGDLPPGTTFLGIASAAGTDVEQVRLPGDRERIRQFSVISLLNYLRLKLLSSIDRGVDIDYPTPFIQRTTAGDGGHSRG
jgi:nicotinamide mononucleotide (NMN) deamidase PncC